MEAPVRFVSTLVIENCKPNFRFGSKPVIRFAARERPFLAQLGRHGEEVIPQIARRPLYTNRPKF
jgi:hypothetical protein